MRRVVRVGLSAMLMVLLGGSLCVQAQQVQGSFTGTVTDPSGAVIPGVKVTALEVNTGFSRSAVTLEDGSYEIPLLPPGLYRLNVEKPGFEKTSQGPIELTVNAHLKVDMQMKVGSQTTTVTVEATPLVLDTQTSSVGTTIERERVVQLPLNGRQFLELTLFTPGVVPGTQGSENSERGGAINVNGMRESMNSFWLDGMDNTSIGVGQYVVAPPIDSVQEFRMETGVYDAKFGSNAGAQINVVTKSGTNQFHGSAYEFLRNARLDARNFFEPSVPHFVRNQFGATAGGPISVPHVYDGHDRTFFFAAYEGLRERRAFFNRAHVPTMAERSGDFSDLLDPSCSRPTLLLDPLALLGGQVQPFTNVMQVLGPLGFPGPDPVGQALVNLYPPPNVPNARCGDANFVTPQTRRIGLNSWVGRVDHRWGTKDSMFFRYNLNLDDSFFPSGGVPGFGKLTKNGFQMVGWDWTHSFSPNVINEAKLSYNRWQLRWNNEDQGRLIAQQLGIKNVPTAARMTGVPNLNIGGFDGMGAGENVPQAGAVNTFEYADTLTHVRGNHSLAYGFDIRSIRRGNFFIDSVIRGEFDFTGTVTGGLGQLTSQQQQGILGLLGLPPDTIFGNGATDALLGLPTYWINGFSGYISGAGTEYDFFGVDNWRVRKDFTLNLGLRYEFNSLVTDKQDHFASFDFQKGLLIVAGRKDVTLMDFNPTTGLYDPVGVGNLGSTAANRAVQRPYYRDIAPRVGFSWQPFGSTKTVVRSGYGIYYDQTFGDVYFQKAFNPPFVQISLGTLTDALPLIEAGFAGLPGGILPGTGQVIQNAFEPNIVAPLFPSTSPFELNFRDAFIQQWSFDVQRELPGSWLLDVGYLGTQGMRLPRETDPNQVIPGTGERPFNQFSQFSYTESSGKSAYHSLQLKVERHYSKGLTFIGAYTWSKSIDTNSTIFGTDRNSNFPQDSRNLAAERGLSDFDFRQRLSLAYVYDLPIGNTIWKSRNSKANYLIEGWQVSGIVAAQSGAPFTPSFGGDVSCTQEGNDRPDLVGNPYPSHQTVDQWVLPSAFRDPRRDAQGNFIKNCAFGNAGRNILIGPGLGVWDFSLIRNFRLTESKRLEFRAEMFNIFNRPNFNTPNRDANSTSFGRIFNTVQPIAGDASGGPGDPREIQFALKFIW